MTGCRCQLATYLQTFRLTGIVGRMSRLEWYPAPPTTAQRWIAGCWLAVFAMLLGNSHFDWLPLGAYDKKVSTAWMVFGLVLFFRFMPTTRRVNDG